MFGYRIKVWRTYSAVVVLVCHRGGREWTWRFELAPPGTIGGRAQW